jgi:hypothetical protein
VSTGKAQKKKRKYFNVQTHHHQSLQQPETERKKANELRFEC